MRTHLESTKNSCMPRTHHKYQHKQNMSGASMHIIYTQTSFKAQKLKLINLKMKRDGGTSHASE